MIRITIETDDHTEGRILTELLEIPQDLRKIKNLLHRLLERQGEIMADLTQLQAEVERNTAVDESAITLLNGLAAQIESIKTDPAALQALANSLKSSSDALAQAVVANTPAA